ncbi:cellulose biosynthesis protein BcsQ [Curvibacter sp. RS43]|jgi:cellulose synthase operon protein YhjQ|uniref:Cellulose biosynthesis protein BcsQ n=1 Tax=Curvibacter microcysteis TaxID=3026419 RepID=A0ABT5MJY1_9BURK|nr:MULTISPECIES: cellulose biosynthesis protein BcsQ [unclassified Curvibacter]MDD0810847.1 cellulose biosynthesis protein BcsQ [Curvibacter sp. RS43]MDD0816197.1 cellulose biosynthesis protein BcsQ [Curvibacter sp. HBC28]
MKIIAVVSSKGGVGKTTVTANLANALARQGRTVVVMDLDPQNALGLHFGIAPTEYRGVSRASLSGQSWRSVVFESRSGVYVLPYGVVNEDDRDRFEQSFEGTPDWLTHQLSSLNLPPDALVLLDTPPGPSAYMKQALHAAHLAVLVVLADAASYAALPMMQRLVQTYCVGQPHFIDSLYVVNQTDSSRQLSKDVTNIVRSSFGERVVGVIHQDQSVGEALAHDQSVLDYEANSQAAQDFRACAQKIALRLPTKAFA